MQHHTFGSAILTKALFLLLIIQTNGVAGQTCPDFCGCFGFRLICETPLPDGRIPDWIPETTDGLTLISDDLRNISAADLGGLPNLRFLQVISRNIEYIEPGAFSPLTNLNTLAIYLAQAITVIDENLVRGLPQLEALSVEGTSVDRVTEGALRILPKLRRLNVIADNFRSLPDNFLSGSNITHLYMDSNFMSNISSNAFGSLSSLVELSLADNNLNVISGDIFQNLYNLEILNLRLNNIAFVNASTFNALKSLRVINLEGNAISYLPSDTFRNLSDIVELNLASNALSFLPHRLFGDLLSLSILDLSGNRLMTLYRTVFDFNKVIDEVLINLAGNPLHCDCNIEWLNSTMDSANVICASPANVVDRQLSLIDANDFECTSTGFIGSSVLLVCPGWSNPVWQITWVVPDGRRVNPDTASGPFEVTPDGDLVIATASSGDAGVYMCYVVDADRNFVATETVSLELSLPPGLTTDRADTTEDRHPSASVDPTRRPTVQPTEGRMTTSQTQSNSNDAEIVLGEVGSISPNMQYPENYNFIWITSGGVQIETNETVDRFTVLIDGTLLINPVIESDDGIYRISVINFSNIVVSSTVVRVTFANAMSTSAPTEPTESATGANNTEAPQSSPSLSPTTSIISSPSPPVTEQKSSTADPDGIILVDRDGAFLISPKPANQVDVIIRWVTPDGQILFLNDSSGPYSVNPEGDLQIRPVNDVNVGTYVVFVTDMSGFELDIKVFRVQIAPGSTTASEADRTTTSAEGRTTLSSDIVTPASENRTSPTTESEGTTTQQAGSTSNTEENVNPSDSTTLDSLPSTEGNVNDQDNFIVSITSLQRVVLSPEYLNLQNLNVIWVTPDTTRITKNQTIGLFSVSNDGFLTVEPVLDSLIGVYTAVITDSSGVVLDLNVIRVVFTLPTTQPTTITLGQSTTLPFDSSTVQPTTSKTTVIMTTSTESTTTIATEDMITERETTTMTTTEAITDRDLFTVILYSRSQGILSPRYPLDLQVNIIWVTPDGERLTINDTVGPYEVRSDGNLFIQPVEDISLGVYTATITTLDNTLIDLNIIRVEFRTPSTSFPDLTTIEVTNSTTLGGISSTDDPTTFYTSTNASGSSQPADTTESNNEPTDGPTSTSAIPDEDFFVVILTQRVQAIVYPQYSVINNTDVLWVTPDAIMLRRGESRGPYNVTDDGRLIIQPVGNSNLGTYTVSVTDGLGFLQDLNVIRVQYSEPTATTPASGTSTSNTSSDSPVPSSTTGLTTESRDSTSIQTTLNPLTTADNALYTTSTENSTPLLSTEMTESRSTSQNGAEMTSRPILSTTIPLPEELFLREGQMNVVFPRIPNGININVSWVTADGSVLSKGDTVGSYSVNNLGQLLISRVSEAHEGPYSVLLTNSDEEFIGLYVIRVIVNSGTSQEPTQTVVTSTDLSPTNGTSMFSATQTSTDVRQTTGTTNLSTLVDSTTMATDSSVSPTNPEVMSTSLITSSSSSPTPSVTGTLATQSSEAETTGTTLTSTESESTPARLSSTILTTSADATSTMNRSSTSSGDITTRAATLSTTPMTSGETATTLENTKTTPTVPSVSTSQTEPFSTTPVSTPSKSEESSTSSTINTISSRVTSTQPPSTSDNTDATLSSVSSSVSTIYSFTPTTPTTDEATTEYNILTTTDAPLPETSSQISPGTELFSLKTDDILTDTTTVFPTTTKTQTERIPTTRMWTEAGTESRPTYLIPLSVGIGLAGIAFLLILLSLCLALAKNHKEDYGVHIIEQEKTRKGELVPIGDVDEESGGLGNHGKEDVAENGISSNPYTLEPERTDASDSRLVSMVGKGGSGYDTIYYVDSSVQGANDSPADNVFY